MPSKEIKTVLRNPPIKKSQTKSDGFTGEIHEIFNQEVTPILYKFFQKTEKRRIFFNSFYEVHIAVILKPDKAML